MIKTSNRKIHRWIHSKLGLVSGFVVFIVGITGFLYAFEQEIQELSQDFRFYEAHKNETNLLPSNLIRIAKTKLPNHEVHSVKYVRWDTQNRTQGGKYVQRAAEVIFYHSDTDSTYYYKVFINPISGEILQVHNMLNGFFAWVLRGHLYLWLPTEVGRFVVASNILIFFILIFFGMILWIPKTWNLLKNWKIKLILKWNEKTRWRRKNFDLHGLFGVYAFFSAIVFSITGLFYGFNWWAAGYYKILGGKHDVFYSEPEIQYSQNLKRISEFPDSAKNHFSDKLKRKIHAIENKVDLTTARLPIIDQIYLRYRFKYRQLNSIVQDVKCNSNIKLHNAIEISKLEYSILEIHPQKEIKKCWEVSLNPSVITYGGADYRFIDPETLGEQSVKAVYGESETRTFAEKMILWNYDIHTGAIFGLGGKVIMALFSLIIAFLPVSGFLIWLGRNFKTKIVKV
jgi:uncharacterized iron-regulated membrane protein